MAKLSYVRISFLAVSASIAVAVGYYFGDDMRVAEKPSEYIGVTFSILAASLFAVISIIGDPSMILPGNWRVGYESARQIQSQIQVFNYLFVWYLATLGLLVATELVESAGFADYYWLFNVFAGFATFGFMVSFSVPFILSGIQRERLRQEITFRAERKGGQ